MTVARALQYGLRIRRQGTQWVVCCQGEVRATRDTLSLAFRALRLLAVMLEERPSLVLVR